MLRQRGKVTNDRARVDYPQVCQMLRTKVDDKPHLNKKTRIATHSSLLSVDNVDWCEDLWQE